LIIGGSGLIRRFFYRRLRPFIRRHWLRVVAARSVARRPVEIGARLRVGDRIFYIRIVA
jgi:hypothetical protein